MPEILADEYRSPTPARIERRNLQSGLDEALLLKNSVRRQKYFAVYVPEPRAIGAEFRIQRRIVDEIVVLLVETDHGIDRPDRTRSTGPRLGESIEHSSGGNGMFPDAALQEISGGGGFRKNDKIRGCVEAVQPSKTVGDTVHAGSRVALVGAKLGEREIKVHFDSERL